MPYNNEYANPRGHEALLLDELLKERLQTYSFKPPQLNEDSVYTLTELKKASELPETIKLQTVKQAFAIDGSIAKINYELPNDVCELAGVKIGVVKQNLEAFRTLANQYTISQEEYKNLLTIEHRTLLFPGKGIYTESISEWQWQDKLREELFFFFKRLTTPFVTHSTLLELYKNLLNEDRMFTCYFCWGEHGMKENIIIRDDYDSCPTCYRDIYITDALFVDINAADANLYTSLMLTIERLFFYGLVKESEVSFEESIFLIDGPLALFKNYFLNTGFLKTFQMFSPAPIIAGFEKTGTWPTFAKLPQVQEQLQPGMIAMVTTELDQLLAQRHTFVTNPYFYGKRFLYRSLDGHKTFVFMAPPAVGNPYKLSENDTNSDFWENYPHLKTICDFIEENSTNRFSLETPSLAIIAEANHAASLPKAQTEKLLANLITSAQK